MDNALPERTVIVDNGRMVLRGYLGEVPFVSGLICEELFAYKSTPDDFDIIFLRLSGHYHRVYVDLGLLYWDEVGRLDAKDEMGVGGEYEDLTNRFMVRGRKIRFMKNEKLVFIISFTDGYEIEFTYREEDDVTQLQFFGFK
ncbi:hypothetical protein TPR58_18040 [Sphingomonas sp. HF-S3]|uniref:Uncharacterized protein n=2 Tax=Sphingomonas rustica TaxID=3103142 RepID=A0ABV0BC04_9SPHN